MTAAAETPLDVDGLAVAYDRRPVLDGVRLAVRPGEIFGLIGLNGVGKTTLIKAVLDLVRPAAGRIRLFGIDHRETASRRNLAYLPERFQPSANLTGLEFLALTLSSYGQRLDRPAALAFAEAFGLDPAALRRRMASYSKGMGQKLGLMATLFTERPLLILDEPMSGLDPLARHQLKQHLAAYRGQGRTVFFSSHILADMEEICDRVAVLHGGAMRFCGTPGEMMRAAGTATLEPALLHVIGARGAG